MPIRRYMRKNKIKENSKEKKTTKKQDREDLKSLKKSLESLSTEMDRLSDLSVVFSKPQLDGYTNNMLVNAEKEAYRKKNSLPKIHDKSKLSFYDRMRLGLARHLVQYAVENKKNFVEMAKLCESSPRFMESVFQYNYYHLDVKWLLECLYCLAQTDKKVAAYMELFEAVSLVPVDKVKMAQKVLQKETEKRV